MKKSLDHENIMFPHVGAYALKSMLHYNWLIIKVIFGYIRKYVRDLDSSSLDIAPPDNGEIYSGPSRYYNVTLSADQSDRDVNHNDN
jgi:hypothetical protein